MFVVRTPLACLGIALFAAAAAAAAADQDKADVRQKAAVRNILSPETGRRVVANAAAVTAGLRQVVEDDARVEGELLRELVDGEATWRLYYRDRQLLFAIPVRRNLLGNEKHTGEAHAAALARTALQQKFSKLLALKNPSASLDDKAVRVVFIEPDAETAYVGGASGGSPRMGYHGTPLPFAVTGAWTGWAAPTGGCGCH